MRRLNLIFLLIFIISSVGFAQNLSEKEYELLDAAEKGDSQKILSLLNDKTNPDVYDYYGMGPLHYAAQNGHTNSVKALILNEASVDLQDYDGRTALQLAVHFNHLDIAEFLVQNKADINKTDIYGLSPLFYSSAYGDLLMTDMFLFYSDGKEVRDPEGKTQFLVAVWGGHLEVAQLLLSRFSDVNEKDYDGNNAVHLAVLNKDTEMIDSLFVWGCDIDAINNNGYSCLDLAIQENATWSVEKLLSLKADPNNKIKKGVNSLDLALHYTQNPEIVRLMEDAGAERNKRVSFSQPAVSIKLNSSFQDAFYNVEMQLWEPKYGIGLKLGASQRIGRLKVLSEPMEDVRYQYRESRIGIITGINKQWMLFRINRNKSLGMNLGFDIGLYMGNNKGSTISPDKIWAPMPHSGLYLRSGSWQFGIAGLYQNMKVEQMNSLRMSLSATYRFNELK